MAARDPAFMWETEVLRASARTPRGHHGPTVEIDELEDWLTLREASDATGVPSSTIRKWAKHENIPSYLERTTEGFVRLVSMRGIERWADQIGRDLESPDTPPASSRETELPEPGSPPDSVEEPGVPEGSMLVPLDAWNRMLNQLGNLHEAGQQLAEARERAAKAETEASFLKERLADLRDELERVRDEPEPATDQPVTSTQGPGPTRSSPTSLVRRAYRSWRTRRS